MSADYLPVHDPAVHGHAYAVKVTGRDTVAFAAIRDEDEACRCGKCPGTDPDEKGALLSCGPGVVSKMWRTRIRNGEWDDIRALFRTARKRVEDAAEKGQDAIHNNLDCDWHDIAAVFRADTGLLTDPQLDEGLRQMEADLVSRAGELRRWVAERAEAIRNEAETRAA